jgi:hypothetical protein
VVTLMPPATRARVIRVNAYGLLGYPLLESIDYRSVLMEEGSAAEQATGETPLVRTAPVRRVRPRLEVRGMSAFGHYLLACRSRAGCVSRAQ